MLGARILVTRGSRPWRMLSRIALITSLALSSWAFPSKIWLPVGSSAPRVRAECQVRGRSRATGPWSPTADDYLIPPIRQRPSRRARELRGCGANRRSELLPRRSTSPTPACLDAVASPPSWPPPRVPLRRQTPVSSLRAPQTRLQVCGQRRIRGRPDGPNTAIEVTRGVFKDKFFARILPRQKRRSLQECRSYPWRFCVNHGLLPRR